MKAASTGAGISSLKEARPILDVEKETAAKSHQSSLHRNGRHHTGSSESVKPYLTILIGFGTIALLHFASSVILPIVIAFVAAMVLKPAVMWLAHRHIPRALAALLILGLFVSAIGIGFVELRQPAMNWMKEAPQNIAKLRQKLEQLFPAEKFQKAIASTAPKSDSSNESDQASPVPASIGAGAGKALTWTGGLVGALAETMVLLYMFLVLGDKYLNQVLEGSNKAREKQVIHISHNVQKTLSKYMFTVSIINLGLGVAVGAGLYALGIPNAALWGMLAGLLNYIPYFGPIVGLILVGLVSVLTQDSLPRGLFPVLWYFLIHLTEANFVTPYLLGRQFRISPLVIFISLMFWTWLWGPLGALLSMPILMSLKVVCREIPKLAGVARFL